MKTYQGTKTVKAEPMTKTEAEKFLGREIKPATSGEDGYLVKYSDGYKSWSPKEVFDAVYQIAETPLDRLKIEHSDLRTKFKKLCTFINSDKFKELDPITRAMLLSQKSLMADYQYVLAFRSVRMGKGEGGYVGLSFGTAISLLEKGFVIRREGWNGKGLIVFKQVPAHITESIIPNMQSLPAEAKKMILSGNKHIDYTSQCLIYNTQTGRADSWVPSISDVFAKDWELVTE